MDDVILLKWRINIHTYILACGVGGEDRCTSFGDCCDDYGVEVRGIHLVVVVVVVVVVLLLLWFAWGLKRMNLYTMPQCCV